MRPYSLRPKAQLAWGLLLLGLALGQAPATTGEGQEPAATASAGVSGERFVVTPDEIETLLNKKEQSPRLRELPEKEKESLTNTALSLFNFNKMHAAGGYLNAEGCYYSADIYHKPLYILQEEEDAVSLPEVIERADVAGIASITSSQAGIIGASPGTLFRVKFTSSLNMDDTFVAREWYFVSREYRFTVNGELFCHEIDGFYRPQEGDNVLLIARRSGLKNHLLVYAVFKISDGTVMPQPYRFITPMNPMAVSALLRDRH